MFKRETNSQTGNGWLSPVACIMLIEGEGVRNTERLPNAGSMVGQRKTCTEIKAGFSD